MGFNSGLCAYPKYKDYTYKDYSNIVGVLDYYTDSFVLDRFKSLEDYCNACGYNVVDIDVIDFFNTYASQRGSNKPYRDFGSWGSASKIVYEIIANYKEAVDQERSVFELNHKDVATILEYLFEEFTKKYAVKKGSINYSFRLVDGEGENITLNRCDGVEFVLLDDNDEEQQLREYTSDKYQSDDPNLGIVIDFDFWNYYSFRDIIHSFITILETVDFDKEVVFFESGW